jgi:DMSO reductase family type II enzyme heme b subunit
MAVSIELVAAPTSIQPGGYIATAYTDRRVAHTVRAKLGIENTADSWRILLTWACPEPVKDASNNTNAFVDSAALLVPQVSDAPMITMGAEGFPVEGAFWRADKEEPIRIDAQGLGSVVRSPAVAEWKVIAEWADGFWGVRFDVGNWLSLNEHRQMGIAIWQGKSAERGGLKSVTENWLDVGEYTK